MKLCCNFSLITFLLFFGDGNLVHSHRILSIFLLTGTSSMNYFDAIHLELAKNGHQITVITPTPSQVKHKNIKELKGLDNKKVFEGMVPQNSEDFFQMRLSGERMATPFVSATAKFSETCEALYQLPEVQKLIKKGPGQFSGLLTMSFMNECVYGLFHHLNASMVLIGATPTMPWFAGSTGSPTPLSFVPHIYYNGAEEMNFLERMGNVLSFGYQLFTRNYIYLPGIEKAYQKFVPNAPSVNEVERNVSLVLGAGHTSFGPIRPSMPDLIDDIGGIHCRPAKPLPKEIQEMITDPSSGKEQDFILFSFGSMIQGHQIPEHIKQAFLKTFAKLSNFKILWKWETDSMNGVELLPENVRLSKWLPQQDLLGHPKCKLFITHGGLSSLHESIYHGVPVIGIPFFGDQDWNMKQVEYHGIGKKLGLVDINGKVLTKLVEEVLNNPKYSEEVSRRSVLFRDRQVSALDKAVWNIEYVLRHGGAPHLRSPARDMSIIQYYCIDILLFILAMLFVPVYIFFFVLRVFLCQKKSVMGNRKNNKRE